MQSHDFSVAVVEAYDRSLLNKGWKELWQQVGQRVAKGLALVYIVARMQRREQNLCFMALEGQP